MHSLIPFLAVGLGSMAGGISRYGLTLVTQNVSAFSLPYGTLISNLGGCLVIGLIAALGAKTELMSTELRLLLATGNRHKIEEIAAIAEASGVEVHFEGLESFPDAADLPEPVEIRPEPWPQP